MVLYDLYEEATGLKLSDVHTCVREEFVRAGRGEDAPRSQESIANTLRRGTDNIYYLRGFATAFNRPLETIEIISANTMREERTRLASGMPATRRRGPRKSLTKS